MFDYYEDSQLLLGCGIKVNCSQFRVTFCAIEYGIM